MNKVLKAFIIAVLIFSFPLAVSAKDELYVASAEGEVTLKILPDDQSSKILSIPACSKVELIKKINTWGLVVFEKKCGWINLSFTAENYTDAANFTGRDAIENAKVHSKDGSVNLYNVPSLNEHLGSKVKYTVPNGTILNITHKTDSGWALVSMNGKFAWVETRYTQKHESLAEEKVNNFGIYYVYVVSDKGKGLSLRSSKGGGDVLTVIPDCIKLTVRKKENGYGYVSFDGYNGWINLKYTTNSLSNAQSMAGVAVNEEMSVSAPDGEVNVMSLPTDYPQAGNETVGSIKNGTAVFVQRQTASGWCYVSNAGVKGWIMPGVLSEADAEYIGEIKTVKPYEVYATANGESGQSVYSEAGAEQITVVPPGLKMRIVAETGDYGYAVSDYAAGWVELSETSPSYDASVKDMKKNSREMHKVINQAEVMAIPLNSEIYADKVISVLEVDDEVIVYSKVKMGSEKWGLIKLDGNWGWISLSNTKELAFPIGLFIIALSIILAAVLAVISLILIIRRKRK